MHFRFLVVLVAEEGKQLQGACLLFPFSMRKWIFIWTPPFYPWLPCAVILFQIEYVAVSNTKFHLEETEVRLTGCMELADYPPLFALLKMNSSLIKVLYGHLSNS